LLPLCWCCTFCSCINRAARAADNTSGSRAQRTSALLQAPHFRVSTPAAEQRHPPATCAYSARGGHLCCSCRPLPGQSLGAAAARSHVCRALARVSSASLLARVSSSHIGAALHLCSTSGSARPSSHRRRAHLSCLPITLARASSASLFARGALHVSAPLPGQHGPVPHRRRAHLSCLPITTAPSPLRLQLLHHLQTTASST
jgi:hypothetical protein